MKKLIADVKRNPFVFAIFLSVVIMFICIMFKAVTTIPPTTPIVHQYPTRKIEGCEYIRLSGSLSPMGADNWVHKGNCSNPIHNK